MRPRSLDLKRDSAAAYDLLSIAGGAWLRIRDYARAVECLSASLKLNMGNAETWCELDVAYYELGDHSSALDCFNRSLQTDPTYTLAQNNRTALVELIGGSHTDVVAPTQQHESAGS